MTRLLPPLYARCFASHRADASRCAFPPPSPSTPALAFSPPPRPTHSLHITATPLLFHPQHTHILSPPFASHLPSPHPRPLHHFPPPDSFQNTPRKHCAKRNATELNAHFHLSSLSFLLPSRNRFHSHPRFHVSSQSSTIALLFPLLLSPRPHRIRFHSSLLSILPPSPCPRDQQLLPSIPIHTLLFLFYGRQRTVLRAPPSSL